MGALAQIRIACLEQTLVGLDWLARRRGRGDAQPAHLTIGIDGENAAYFHLRRSGFTVVARRWSAGNLPGDIDLVAWQGPVLCFVEVKARTARDATAAEVAVDSHKRHILRRLARQYMRQLPGPEAPPVRFDVVSVYLVPQEPCAIEHFQNAFGWSERKEDWE